MPVDPFLRSLLPGFAEEAEEIIARVSRDVFELERIKEWSADTDASYASLARGLHTLKGSAGSVGLDDLASLAHRLEDVLAPSRATKVALRGYVADALLKGLDLFRARVNAHARDETLPPMDQLLAILDDVVGAA